MVQPIPEGLENRIIPYLMIEGAAEALDFYAKAFGAIQKYRLNMPDGGIGHAEIEVNGATVYLADAPDDMEGFGGAANPSKLGGTSVLMHLYVTDVDASAQQAVGAGATLLRPPEDQFYGDRAAVVVDPSGHQWSLHTHIRDVSPEEMTEAMENRE
ncbi:MAG: VOC family protein [Acidimicrobiia bacterium]|nr:VOC family protein [Acidimicrobiia bacterium]